MSDYVERIIGNYKLLLDKYLSSKIYVEKSIAKIYGSSITVKDLATFLAENNDSFPLSVRCELTSRCNMNCPFCYIHNHAFDNDITFEQLKPVIDKLVDKGLLFMTLTGGECFLNKDFIKIYKYLKEKGVLLKVFTNGLMINDEIIDVLTEYKPRRVEVTIYNSIKDVPVVFENILKLKSKSIPVLVKMTVTKTNVKIFDEVEKWCIQNNLNFKFVTQIFDSYDKTSNKEYQLSIEEAAKLDRKVLVDYLPEPDRVDGIKCFQCNGGSYSYVIDSGLNLRICGKIDNPKYSLQKYSLDYSIQQLQLYVSKYKNRPIIGCTGCKAYPICNLCFASAVVSSNRISVDKKFCVYQNERYKKIFNK